jgi:hypothetical protein
VTSPLLDTPFFPIWSPSPVIYRCCSASANIQMPRLSACPEELIESILHHALAAPSRPPTWHSPSRSRLAVLQVSTSFYRIAMPLFYHSISIHSAAQLQRLLAQALRPNPRLASFIHHIILPAIWPDAGELLSRSSINLRFLDITLDSLLNTQAHDPDTEQFCQSLHQLHALTHIVVRKPNNVYLTRPKLQNVLSEMSKAMHAWPDLVCFSLINNFKKFTLFHRNTSISLSAFPTTLAAQPHSSPSFPSLSLSTIVPAQQNYPVRSLNSPTY